MEPISGTIEMIQRGNHGGHGLKWKGYRWIQPLDHGILWRYGAWDLMGSNGMKFQKHVCSFIQDLRV